MEKLKNAILRNINSYRKKPISAHLEMTYRCNLLCKFCGFGERLTNMSESELSTDKWFKIIENLKSIGVKSVVLVGAEPLIRKDIGDIIAYIKKQDIRCLLITNGTLLNKEKARFLVENQVDKIAVSIDGPQEIHDKIRGVNGVFKQTTTGIRNLVAARNDANSLLPKIEIHTTICSLNVRSLDSLVAISKELSVDSVSLQHLSEIEQDIIDATILDSQKIASTQFTRGSVSLLLNKEEVQIMYNKILQIRNRGLDGLSFRTLRCFPESYLQCGHFPIKKCYTINTDIQIDPYGNLYPCALLRNYYLGSAIQQDIREIWNGQKYNKLRILLARKLLPICRYCCHYNANLTFKQGLNIYLGRMLNR